MKRRSAIASAVCALSAAVLATTAVQAAAPVTLKATGSTLMSPLLNRWMQQYRGTSPDVHIMFSATGSGAGIAQAIAGAVQFGASDAYMTDEQTAKSPGILNIPLAISSQLISYNLPGLNGAALKLDDVGRCRHCGDESRRETAARCDRLDPSQR
jgi:phosphate transport system substrate-binding protein